MAYLNNHGLETFWTKIKTTFAKKLGSVVGTDKVTIQLKDGATTSNVLDSLDIDAASTTSAGVMSKEDKTKLNGIESEANKYIHPTTSGNKHIPSGGASGNILGWESDGTAKWVASPSGGVTKVKAGTNVNVSSETGEVTVSATDTTYESKSAVSGGTDVSLCTTGEKYTWNGKQDKLVFGTSYDASSNKAATIKDIDAALFGAAKYKGTLASDSAFNALTNYKVGDYYIVSTAFDHTEGTTTVSFDVGNMILVRSDYSTAFAFADFDIIQSDIEAIPDTFINALS